MSPARSRKPTAAASSRPKRRRAASGTAATPAESGAAPSPRAARRARGSRRADRLEFAAIEIVGALLLPDIVARAAAFDLPEQAAEGYGIPPGLGLRDEIARAWRIGEALWARYQAGGPSTRGAQARPAATARFVTDLLKQCFGFDSLVACPPVTLEGRTFPVGHAATGGRVPVVIAPAPGDDSRRAGLDESLAQFGDGTRRRSATLLLQEFLNASDVSAWGLACDGLVLRLMRDNASMTRPAWIEAGLARIFSEGLYADFSAVWLLIHASRFGRTGAAPTDCALERWREQGRSEGMAARDRLRDGVEAALVELGQGFIEHPANGALRQLLADGKLTPQGYFEELLRLVYRLIFLFAAEDRGLLHAPGAEAEARRLYAEGYSLGRLRERATRRVARDRHGDCWVGLKASFTALARGEARLGLPALGGLFDPGALPHLGHAYLENRRLLEAIWRLAWMRPEGQALTRVNWRDMQTEELGSVYESLLELVPRASADARQFGFAGSGEDKGNARKTSGSYYTPDSLVQLVLDSALDPVLDAAEARNPADPASEILKLAILDPACGSGHFLLGAARRVAARLARLRSPGVPDQASFQHALREVVAHCIHGVDRNPMAVELCKVALWIETVEPGRPLGFLDSRIRCGDSLLGVFDLKVLGEGIPDGAYKPLSGDDKDVAKHYAAKNRRERAEADRVKGGFDFGTRSNIAKDFSALQAMPETTVDEIAGKAKRLAELTASGSASWTLARACDLQVAAFLLPKAVDARFAGADGLPRRGAETVPTTGTVGEVLRGGQPFGSLMAAAGEAAAVARAFHWPLEFPDVMARGGFDAVVGNPPWERIKLQEQEFFAARSPEIAGAPNKAAREKLIKSLADAPDASAARMLHAAFVVARRQAEATSEFVRVPADEGGRFPLTGRGDVNTYALFAEHFSRLSGPSGRAGAIVPTGIATDATTAPFFAALVAESRLARLVDFENRAAIFPGVHRSYKFCILTVGRNEPTARFAFFLTEPAQLAEPERSFVLTPADIERLNPNTRTAPVFRSRADADVTAKIYRNAPVLIDESKGESGNPWGVSFARLFDMSNDSGLFRTAAQLGAAGFMRAGPDWAKGSGKNQQAYVPLYEAKMIHQFDHRWAGYASNGEDSADVSLADKRNPAFEPAPRYWVPRAEVDDRLAQKGWNRGWLMGWRGITNATNERTVIAAVFPACAVGNSLPLMLFDASQSAERLAGLTSSLSSLALDYAARHKVGGTNLNFFVYQQLPVILPTFFTPQRLAFMKPRVLELTYTSHALAPFARDLGHQGPPFPWNEDRRALLCAELDAFYARAYGLTRDELRHVLDPADVRGVDYPSETFRVLKNNEIAKYGEYRTRRLVLEAWDRLGLI